MASMTNYTEKKLLDHVLGLASFTMPAAHLGLSTSNPGETGSFSGEPSGNGYARQNLTAAMGATNATTGVAVNTSIITFGPVVTSSWGTITHALVADASSSQTGNCTLFGALSQSRDMPVAEDLQFAASAFSITFA